ncbi:MAG: hypothetical protein QME81_20060 [bacterium]|nr:hypothetical protein [bacterium]
MGVSKFCFIVVVCLLLIISIQVWQKTQITKLGYTIAKLKRERDMLQDKRRALAIELSYLGSAANIFEEVDELSQEPMGLKIVRVLIRPEDLLPGSSGGVIEAEAEAEADGYLAVFSRWVKKTDLWVTNQFNVIKTQIDLTTGE